MSGCGAMRSLLAAWSRELFGTDPDGLQPFILQIKTKQFT